MHGVPIEKVRVKQVMHSDWAHGATGAPKGHLGRSNFGQGHVFMGRLNFRQGHIYRLFGGGENFFLSLFKFTTYNPYLGVSTDSSVSVDTAI